MTSRGYRAGRPARKRRAARPRPSSAARIAHYAAHAVAALFFVLVVLSGGAYLVIRDLPAADVLVARGKGEGPSFVARDGSPILQEGRYVGAEASLDALPRHVVEAALAIEDRNFYHHVGINPLSIVRALIINLRDGDIRQGGSTITQQLAKNLFLTPDRTFSRKLQEAFLAVRLERRYSKDELLALYLNRAYFGAGAYGVVAAADRYFAKPPSALTIGEAALLAGLLQAPTRYAPNLHPEVAGRRAQAVIAAMVDAGYLDYFTAQRVLEEPVRLRRGPLFAAPFFVDAARREARDRLPASAGTAAGAIVTTTLSPALQAALEAGVASGVRAAGLSSEVEVAAALVDGDGAVRALIGGRDYSRSQFNRALDARRQPGSAFKPFVYIAALEAGASPQDLVSDAPVAVGSWRPSNYNERHRGYISLIDALSHSANAATVRVQELVGRPAVRAAARRMGVESPLSAGAALGLGVDVVSPLELAAAYAPFANGGFRARPFFVEAVSDPLRGQLYRRERGVYDRAIEPKALSGMQAMLRAVVEEGTGRAARLDGVETAGKTGTTQENRDAWFVGYADGLTLAVWTGRDDNRPMEDVTGGGAAATIWREAMIRILSERQGAAPAALMSLHVVPWPAAPPTPSRKLGETTGPG